MLQSWRWFGPKDPISLREVRQAGASGIVTALHQIADKRAWADDDVLERKAAIEAAGLTWSVCESIPVPTALKIKSGDWVAAIGRWKDSLAALGRAGIPVVCYNFMPVVDWTRTTLSYPMPSTALALRFDMVDFIAYDVLMLRRRDAEGNYPRDLLDKARSRFSAMSESEKATLEKTIIAGLPGSDLAMDRAGLAREIALYDDVGTEGMEANLTAFLKEVVPVAEEFGTRLAIHPDDPPFPLLGLPRIVSTADDVRRILAAVESPANGITLCCGSYGSSTLNDVPAMTAEFAPHIHFTHMRNVRKDADGSFTEWDHLDGDVDMVAVIETLLQEEKRRAGEGWSHAEIPMRPDHGHLLDAEVGRAVNPGYSYLGRMKGLAELRGIIKTVTRATA